MCESNFGTNQDRKESNPLLQALATLIIQKQMSRSFGTSSSYRSCTPFGRSTVSKGLAKVSHTFSPRKIVLPKLRPHFSLVLPSEARQWRNDSLHNRYSNPHVSPRDFFYFSPYAMFRQGILLVRIVRG